MKTKLISMLICFYFTQESFAQDGKCLIRFTADTTHNIVYKDLTIHIFQNDSLSTCGINEKIYIYKGVETNIEFQGKTIVIPGIKKIKIYQDTSIFLGTKTLNEIIVNSKKPLVKQTMKGFDYYPSGDSIFKTRSIFFAMQRLPFVTMVNEKLEYKQGENILFKINGKERKGIGNNWAAILKVIKAKDIYKVELITEIPVFIMNQGYSVIINILTLDANLYGKTINISTLVDQRENVNNNAGITTLRRRADLSLSLSNSNDRQTGIKSTQVYENNALISNNVFESGYKYHLYNAYVDYGIRMDSATDLSAKIEYHHSITDIKYFNINNFPALLNDERNLLRRNAGAVQLSYVHKVRKSVTQSVSFFFNLEDQRLQNRESFLRKVNNDSINNQINTSNRYWIVEYNRLNTANKSYDLEYGIQVYNKQLIQDLSKYTLDSFNNENQQLLYFKNDSLKLRQNSIRPYAHYNRDLKNKREIIVDLSTEFYSVKNINSRADIFFLPAISFRYKQLLKKNTSLTYNSSFNFVKPGVEYFTPIQTSVDPLENKVGSPHLIPGKSARIGAEFVTARKMNLSHSIYSWYGFNQINFFTTYDAVKRVLINSSNNGGTSKGVNYSIRYQQQIGKKFTASANAGIRYVVSKNKIYQTRNEGIEYFGGNNFIYFLGNKYGTIGVFSFLNSRQISTQGTYRGSIRYTMYYTKDLFKKRLIVSIDADQFLLKNRDVNTYTSEQSIARYTSDVKPYRLISLRLGYNFSDIRMSKLARRKSTFIRGELGE